jgi:hypothetical protein
MKRRRFLASTHEGRQLIVYAFTFAGARGRLTATLGLSDHLVALKDITEEEDVCVTIDERKAPGA